MGKGTAVCTFAAAVTMALTSGVSPSSAAPRPADPAAAVRGDMHVVGFDAAVARAHGYQIKTAANGRQYPARAGAASSAVSPDTKWVGTVASRTFMSTGSATALSNFTRGTR